MASHLGRVVLTALCIFAASSGERVVADDDTAGPTVPSVGTVSELGSVADVGHPVARLTTFSEALRDGTDLAGKLAGVKGEAGLASKELGSDEELVSPEFRAFMKRHNKRQKYCPGSTSDAPCAELLRRELSFLENKATIEAHNARKDTTFTLGFTPFADDTGVEFVTNRLTYTSRNSLRKKRMEKRARIVAARGGINRPDGSVVSPSEHLGVARSPNSFPKNFDWAAVPEVMGKIHTQETSCASCWAYTSTDTIEAQAVISGRRKKHVELSAEQLINCDGYDSGCNTGNMFTAYEWIHENGGLATARTFHTAAQKEAAMREAALSTKGVTAEVGGFDPVRDRARFGKVAMSDAWLDGETMPRIPIVEAEVGAEYEVALGAEEEKRALDAIEAGLGVATGECPANLPLQETVNGYCEIDFEAGEAALMEAVARHPVAIGINANKAFQLYASGIIRAADCGAAPHTQDSEIMSINHAVIVTGWGETMVNGRLMKYWVLKNSFGENWGEKGYFKLERGDHTLDKEGFGTCGMYFESVYPVLDENASAASCLPGGTFRRKYYSTAAVLGTEGELGAHEEHGVHVDSSGLWGAREDVAKAAAILIGFGFVAGIMVTVLSATLSQIYRMAKNTDEEAALLPH